MKDQTYEELSDPVPGSLPDDAKRPGCDSTQHGGKNGEVQEETETWLEQVLDPTNMHSAWQRGRRNGGAPGMDGMTIAQFPAFARQHWEWRQRDRHFVPFVPTQRDDCGGVYADGEVDGDVVALDGIGTGEPGSFRAEQVVAGDALWAAVEISTIDPATGDPVVLASGHRYVPPAAETLAYDEDGNLIEDGRWKYTWDAENRLIGMEEKARAVGGGFDPASLPPRKKLTFAYDARHRRIAKWVHEWDDASSSFSKLVKDLRFLYDGWNMTVELDHTFATGDGLAGSRPVREFCWGPDLSGTMDGAGGVGGLVSMKWQGNYYLPCIDGNGNIKGWLKLLGNNKYELTARYDYDPFGNRITDTGPGIEVSPFGFSTKYRDEETGMLDYGYRFYDPVRGRWLSRDPIGGASSSSNTFRINRQGRSWCWPKKD